MAALARCSVNLHHGTRVKFFIQNDSRITGLKSYRWLEKWLFHHWGEVWQWAIWISLVLWRLAVMWWLA